MDNRYYYEAIVRILKEMSDDELEIIYHVLYMIWTKK